MNVQQMSWRCPRTKRIGNGKVYGWKLVFNYHADIVKSDDPNDYVQVVVWNIGTKKDLNALDRYEGYPTYYVKKNIDVVINNSADSKLIFRGAIDVTDDVIKKMQ